MAVAHVIFRRLAGLKNGEDWRRDTHPRSCQQRCLYIYAAPKGETARYNQVKCVQAQPHCRGAPGMTSQSGFPPFLQCRGAEHVAALASRHSLCTEAGGQGEGGRSWGRSRKIASAISIGSRDLHCQPRAERAGTTHTLCFPGLGQDMHQSVAFHRRTRTPAPARAHGNARTQPCATYTQATPWTAPPRRPHTHAATYTCTPRHAPMHARHTHAHGCARCGRLGRGFMHIKMAVLRAMIIINEPFCRIRRASSIPKG
jgi:hypothetical protein|mmetsp:Transcript_28230/g.47942  ORF Transcript_28230/g.47942 Transcript_28230/m.47942 type:complete len:257 (-) Transcript_28230:697-1467(-)